MRITALIAGGFLPAAFAVPAANYKLHDQRISLHAQYTKGQAATGSAFVPARIALKQQNIEKAEKLLLEISEPGSPKYGQHLAAGDIANLFAPSEESINSVKSWLTASGVPAGSIKVSNSKGWIHFNTTASQLGSFLKTEYHHYTTADGSRTFLGAESYSLPQDVSSLVDFVHPATGFSQMRKRTKAPLVTGPKDTIDPNSLDTCDVNMTPKCIAAQYGIPAATSGKDGNDLAMYEEEGDDYAQEDLDQFFAAMTPSIPKGTGPIVHNLNGANAPANPGESGGESTLDFDMAIPIIYPQKTSLYQMGDVGKDNFDTFVDAFVGPYCKDNGDDGNSQIECNDLKQPNAVSISWGGTEDPNDVAHLKRQCTEWMKFGLAGTSVIIASGDNGVEDGACLGPNHDIFVPDQACSCPWVTTVGSTYLPKGGKVGDVEVATESFASGGGFSNIFPRPDYQNDFVATYLAKYVPDYKSYNTTDGKIPTTAGQGIYNRGGRGYPDVSAVGDNGVVVTNGRMFLNGGTSMSCPIFASIITRINEERLNAGKKPLGFLNPALYKGVASGVFTDIVTGDQNHVVDACGTHKGFVASPGWDPVTGLGTPIYDKMLKYFGQL
ncbi:alkaline serine protease AorO [Cordyceps fumosorosea ARSEF 2679]|uniref:Alkaline serine protease AorO n=1 Tax=Cordyceps fumosorosea (strain ARSEF 2679) TaxID=1081104 RepID=A0A162N1X7_CORFA|nr:alkaline serine protease AorO [Cordyceps fumosorosea ARSEF 2679]OAA74179.1 alkaline serine protease AorO [Cordyceps fumosorosea ARSEF 2679]